MAVRKRVGTGYRNIYYNMSTGRYDIKYNYKVFNMEKQKNDYKSKWKYGLATIDEAKRELDNFRKGKNSRREEEITLQGAYELWKKKAIMQNYSRATIRNAEQYMVMLSRFISFDTKIEDITEAVYEDVFTRCRGKYRDETIKTLNSTLRKLINLSYKKRLITENPLARAENVRAKKTDKIRILTPEEWRKIDTYFGEGTTGNRQFRFMLNILYYTGIRIGECLALTWEDFEGSQEKMRLNISKTILQDGTPKDTTKNKKDRRIPLSPVVIRFYLEACEGSIADKKQRIFETTYNTCIRRLSGACKKLGISHCSCHSFRHTFISNLMRNGVPLPVVEKVSGDTQKTIFERYSHMFEDDEDFVLEVLKNLG